MNEQDWAKLKKLVHDWCYNHAELGIIKNFSTWLGVYKDFMVIYALIKYISKIFVILKHKLMIK